MSEPENNMEQAGNSEASYERNVIEVRRIIRQLRGELDNAPTVKSLKGDGNFCSMRRLETNNLLNALDKFMPGIVADAESVIGESETLLNGAKKEAEDIKAQAKKEAAAITAKAQQSMKESDEKKSSIVADAEKQKEKIRQNCAAMQNDAVARANAIVADANVQASRILAKANQDALQRVSDEEVYRQAMEYAEKIRTDAENYAGSQYRKAAEAIGTIFNQYGHEMEELLQKMAQIQDQFTGKLNESK